MGLLPPLGHGRPFTEGALTCPEGTIASQIAAASLPCPMLWRLTVVFHLEVVELHLFIGGG